ncbi:hypothetical protein C0989_012627 [Termitomyces sp. Mn162]|nr:hypothetical protein C0989_012627 [Termitomyces sp. Mn162]
MPTCLVTGMMQLFHIPDTKYGGNTKAIMEAVSDASLLLDSVEHGDGDGDVRMACVETCNATQHCYKTVSAFSTPQGKAFLDGLEDMNSEMISKLAHNYSSPVSDSGEVLIGNEEFSTAKEDKIPPHSLLDDFLKADNFEPIVLPPGQALGTPTTMTAATTATTTATANTNTKISTNTNTSATSTPNQHDHLLAIDIEKFSQLFFLIDKNFDNAAQDTGYLVDYLKKMYRSRDKTSRHKTRWNIYQAYFSFNHEKELERCGCQTGTAADCFSSFLEKYAQDAKLFEHHLKLSNNQIIGLAKCEAYNCVAQQFTNSFDANELINNVEEALKASIIVLEASKAASIVFSNSVKPKQNEELKQDSMDSKIKEAMACIDGDPIDTSTHMKHKKKVLKPDTDIISVNSSNSPPPAISKKLSTRKVYNISSDLGSDDDDLPLTKIKKCQKTSTLMITTQEAQNNDDYMQDGSGDWSESEQVHSPIKTHCTQPKSKE